MAAVSSAVFLLAPVAAQATPPTREPLPAGDFVLTGHCGFNIDVAFVQNNEILTTFFDSEGNVVRQRITGVLKARLTNLSDPDHSVLFNISGPGALRSLPDGTIEQTGSGGSTSASSIGRENFY